VAAAEAAAIAATSATDNCSFVELTANTEGLCAAVITVTGTDKCGNSTIVSYDTQIELPTLLPVAIAGGSEAICENGSAVVMGVTAANGAILWTHDGTGTLIGSTTATPTYIAGEGDAGKTVILSLTVSGTSGCSPVTATATYTVVVRQHVSAVMSGGATVCANEPLPSVGILFTGTAPWTFKYEVDGIPTTVVGNTANPYVISSPIAGAYSLLSVQDANCDGEVSGSATVTILSDIPTVNAGPDVTLSCTNNRAFLQASGTGTFTWSNGVVDGTFVRPIQTTTYTVTATGANGCKNTDQVTIFTNEVVITCPSDKTINTNSDGYNNYNCSTTILANSGYSPTVTDLCDVSLLKYTLSGATSASGNGTISGLALHRGVTTVTYSALVSAGKSCSFNVTVLDLEAPKAVMTSAQATIVLDACDFPISIPGSTPTPQDNCDSAPSLMVLSDVTADVSGCASKPAAQKYTKLLTRTWRVTDASGNSATATQRIYLRDQLAPTARCKDTTITIGLTNMSLPASIFNNGSSDACASTLTYAICNATAPNSMCTNFASSLTVSRSMIPASASQIIIPVRIRVTDGCGNSSVCTANLTLRKSTSMANPGNASSNTAGTKVVTDSKPAVESGVVTAHGDMKCYPNPFTEDLNISFNLTSNVDKVVLKLYDSTGRLVSTLDQGASQVGYYTARWNLSDLDGGMYNVCLEINDQCKKMQRVILLK